MSIHSRHVKYQELNPCTNAFIDTRSPGSDKKENFTVIGPGVAENPQQHVHISIPHGFNVGGARQPPKCLNSQHSHLTEEVFVVHTGSWDFITGVNADDGRITLAPGDIISIPTDVFRGFENSGDTTGYLHAILGGDDPGRVLWAPKVFDMAKEYGLVLLEDGRLVDTTLGETIPADCQPMPVTTQAQIDEHRIIGSDELENIVIRSCDFDWRTDTQLSAFSGVSEANLVGGSNAGEAIKSSKLGKPHGFVIRALKFKPDSHIPAHTRSEEEVIFVHQGELTVQVGSETVTLGEGDNFTTPIGAQRTFTNSGKRDCIAYVTRRGNAPQPAQFV